MIELRGGQGQRWVDGHVDGIVRDDRVPQPDDGLLSGASFSLGDPDGGPAVMLTITRRLYPKKAPTHRHKSDTFRMALGEPIVVGRTSYAHGEFRLQQVDTFYGPEHWADEVGTNQLLLIADRRGGRPYLTTPELQALADLGSSAEEDLGDGRRQHDRDAVVDHRIWDNTGAEMHAGHWNGGFTSTESWPALPDGSRLQVIALGDPVSGPVLLCWDRPPSAGFPSFEADTDVVRLVVEGSCTIGARALPRLGFRLQQEGTTNERSVAGPDGVRELWLLGDRRGWPLRSLDARNGEAETVAAVTDAVDSVLQPGSRALRPSR